VELAAGKHAKRDGERRQQAKKQKREVPARRVPAEYRCVKSTKTEPKSPEAVEFTCSVSDHTLEPWRRPPRLARSRSPPAPPPTARVALLPRLLLRMVPRSASLQQLYKLWKADVEYTAACFCAERQHGTLKASTTL
tara:strand:- start:156 stop:566 length:411 start_codon:yes stop_codon:yes gene_type:complete